jgi:AraC family L-rhamnose operon regulatory protein RhaS
MERPPVNFARVAKDAFPLFCELQHYRSATGATAHTHDCLELVYVTKGSGVHRIDGEPFPLIPGDLYAIGQGTRHTFQADSELWFYNLLIKPDLFDAPEREELAALHEFAGFLRGGDAGARPKLSFSPPHSDRLAGLLARLTREIHERAPGWRLAAKSLFSEFIVDACRPTSLAERETPDVDGGPVAATLARIHERYTEPLTVEELARLAEVSAGHLGETFKKRTGLTIHQYLTKLRVERARALLEETELSVTEVCHRAGFEDSGYLTRMFKRATGVTPRAYRDQCRRNGPEASARIYGRPPEPPVA